MVSGYCEKCGYPAAHRCPKCDARVCNTHWHEHKCPTKAEADPAPVESAAPLFDAPPVIKAETKKPGQIKVKK